MLGRSWRWVSEQLAFLIVLLGVAVGFAYLLVEPNDWRIGIAMIAVVAMFAGVLRLVLPTARVGLLAVRSRPVDTVLCLAVGALILAVVIRLRT